MTNQERSSVYDHYHPERAQSRVVSEAKQGQAWLVFGWQTDLQRRLPRDKGECVKVQMESLMPDLSKIIKAKRIEEMLLMRVWLSALKRF
jgi:hypothetical protein